jgi:hypothetical protein
MFDDAARTEAGLCGIDGATTSFCPSIHRLHLWRWAAWDWRRGEIQEQVFISCSAPVVFEPPFIRFGHTAKWLWRTRFMVAA